MNLHDHAVLEVTAFVVLVGHDQAVAHGHTQSMNHLARQRCATTMHAQNGNDGFFSLTQCSLSIFFSHECPTAAHSRVSQEMICYPDY